MLELRRVGPCVLSSLICGWTLACGGEDPGGSGAGEEDRDALLEAAAMACGMDWVKLCEAAECSPSDPAWGECRINGWAGYVAPSYCEARSGFLGDDRALCVPDPSEGVQFHYGPADYDDPEAVAQYTLPAGGEAGECIFQRAPDLEDTYFGQYIGRSRPGVHHLQLSYAAAADEMREEGVGVCGSIYATQFITIAQSDTLAVPDLSTPRTPDATDDGGLDFEGGAAPLQSGRMMELTAHYLNTTDEAVLREAWINLYFVEPARVKDAMYPITFITNGIDVPARTTGSLFTRTCKTNTPRTVKYLQGHSHVGMDRFTVWHRRAATGAMDLVYENYDPAEPATLYYSPFVENVAPDRERGIAGGHSGVLTLETSDELVFECEFSNEGDAAVVDGGPGQNGQMCYLFGAHVTPESLANWVCVGQPR